YLHAPVTWLTNSKADKDLRLPQATAQLLLPSWEPLWRRSEEADFLRRWSPRGGRYRRHGCSCRCVGYMRNTPNLAGSIGALRDAETARPSTRRVSAGSMMPSSHSRAVAYHGLPWCSYCSRIGALKASASPALQSPPRASIPSRFTVASTLAACSPPITLMRAFGHIHRKRAP